jgi:hypothetical protein
MSASTALVFYAKRWSYNDKLFGIKANDAYDRIWHNRIN